MDSPSREKRFLAATSVLAAVFLTAAKLLVGVLTGSLGILAEAAHSALDLVAAIVTYFAVRVSDRPADACHLYGHGKVENLSALIETLLLLITCVWIIYEAIHRLLWQAVEVDPSLWAFLVMGISIVIDVSRSRALGRAARKYDSQALEADALHFKTDIWSSAVVIVGLGLVKLGDHTGGDPRLFGMGDAVAALVVAAIVVWVSVRLGRRAVDALLDRAPSGLAERLARSVEHVGGIRGVSRMRLRHAGSRVFVDMEVRVPRYLSFEESHQLTLEAQEMVREIVPDADVVVHAEPAGEKEGLMETVRSVAARSHASIYNISAHWADAGLWIDLDMEVDPHSGFAEAHERASALENRLREELSRTAAPRLIAGIRVHMEPRCEGAVRGVRLEPSREAGYIRKVEEWSREIPGACGSRQIELQELDDAIYLSFHLRVHASLSVRQAHAIADSLERRLRAAFPELGRVVIHTEPEREA